MTNYYRGPMKGFLFFYFLFLEDNYLNNIVFKQTRYKAINIFSFYYPQLLISLQNVLILIHENDNINYHK